MDVVQQLRAFKQTIDAGQPARPPVREITSRLPIRYRTHLLCAWNRYITSRNTYVLRKVIEQLINEMESDRSVSERHG